MHAVDGEDEAQWESSAEWADEDWAAEEHAGAVYGEDDEMIAAFCGCVDCPDLLIEEPNDSFQCGFCDESDEESKAEDQIAPVQIALHSCVSGSKYFHETDHHSKAVQRGDISFMPRRSESS